MEFAALPQMTTRQGDPRRVGVEVEMGGLSAEHVAQTCAQALGGTACAASDYRWTVESGNLGELEVILDTALAKEKQSRLRDLALLLGRDVIPVEIVTPPLDHDGLDRLLPLMDALREAGALGTSAGLTLGFGVHFNVEVASEADRDLIEPFIAYALIEDWLRWRDPIDGTRQVLPFTQPYPTELVRALLELGKNPPLAAVMAVYMTHSPSRNRGLDMLPLFAHLDEEAVKPVMTSAVNPRPTFHFRLPDCRIDEAAWSLAHEWDLWVSVERVAQDEALMQHLRTEWLEQHGTVTLNRGAWARHADDILREAGLAGSDGALNGG